ncbi:MAG TPA: cupin domain-containing protein [Terriglobales bacterium]|nr:cupin domain-containing protein [Terriglobales bacterium]
MATFKVGFSEAITSLFTPESKTSVAVFRHGSLEVKMYAPRKHDPQTTHTRDEVYFVAQGRGTYFHAGERQPFGPGDFLFAAAGVEHRFEDFSDDFFVWVFFYGPEGGEK